MTRVYFFATKDDLLLVLGWLEAKMSVKYTRRGMLPGPEPEVWKSGADIPGLGRAAGDQAVSCDFFLIVDAPSAVNVVSRPMLNGERRYDVEQPGNPDSVLLNVGGEWDDGSLISGSVMTISQSNISQGLMRAIHNGVKKHFTRVRAYWVGPEALVWLRSGKRLTYAVQSPPEYDLKEI